MDPWLEISIKFIAIPHFLFWYLFMTMFWNIKIPLDGIICQMNLVIQWIQIKWHCWKPFFELSTTPALNSGNIQGALTWRRIFCTSKPLILPNLLPQTIVEYRILRHESKVVFRYTFEPPIFLIMVFNWGSSFDWLRVQPNQHQWKPAWGNDIQIWTN